VKIQPISLKRIVRALLLALVAAVVAIAVFSPLLSAPRLPGSSPDPGAGGGERHGEGPAGLGENVRFAVKDWYRVVRSEGSEEVAATIEGESAVLADDGVYTIVSPKVLSVVRSSELPSNGDEGYEVRLTAKGAVFDEQRATLLLYNSVKVEGEDFELVTDNSTYAPRERSVKSSAAVQMKRYRLGPDQQKTLAMTVTGRGLDVDLTLRRMVIPLEPRARLLDVSEDFMASGMPLEAAAGSQEVLITADGSMTYEHALNKVIFRDNVVVTSADKTLKAERLEIVLGTTEGAERLRVTRIEASGDVVLDSPQQTARGQRLIWEDVTQAGALTGAPASLITSDFELRGGSLTFVRLRDRFQADGPGTLVWSAPAGAAAPPQGDQNAPEGTLVAPISLAADEPVEVSWQGGMSYNAGNRTAAFTDAVRATQQGTKLSCDVLELEFDSENQRLKQALARGNVRVTEAGNAARTVLCDRALWNPGAGTVGLSSEPGRVVAVVSGGERLVTTSCVFHPEQGTFECSEPGRIAISGARVSAEDQVAEPIQVSWRDSMRYVPGPERYAEFHGDVEASQPGRTVSAQSIRVDFDEDMRAVKVTASAGAVMEVHRRPEPEAAGEQRPAPAPAAEGPWGVGALTIPGLEQEATDWRLSSDVLVAEPPRDLLYAPEAGRLELLHEDREPDTIRWREEMAVDFRDNFARFEGAVEASFSGSTLLCDSLRLDFNEARELRHVNAEGNMRFRSGGEDPWELGGASAEAMFAPGSVLDQVMAKKDVVVRDAERTLRAQLLKLFFEDNSDEGQPVLSRVVATGGVSVQYAGEDGLKAVCDELNWDAVSNKYRLFGKPATVQTGSLSTNGWEITVDRLSGRMKVIRGDQPAGTQVREEQP